MKFFRIIFVKMTKEHQISNFLPFKPHFTPLGDDFGKNPFLVDTYTRNVMFLAPVVSALRWSSVSQSVSPFIYVRAGSPCFATVNLYLLRKVKTLNFSLLLHYYVNSGQLLNYVHTDICPRLRLHRMCAFKKREKKTPCRMRGIPSNIHQVIKPIDYN